MAPPREEGVWWRLGEVASDEHVSGDGRKGDPSSPKASEARSFRSSWEVNCFIESDNATLSWAARLSRSGWAGEGAEAFTLPCKADDMLESAALLSGGGG